MLICAFVDLDEAATAYLGISQVRIISTVVWIQIYVRLFFKNIFCLTPLGLWWLLPLNSFQRY